MALIKCPDCGTAVSHTADVCPKCGRDMNHISFDRMMQLTKYGFFIFVGFVAVMLLITWIRHLIVD